MEYSTGILLLSNGSIDAKDTNKNIKKRTITASIGSENKFLISYIF